MTPGPADRYVSLGPAVVAWIESRVRHTKGPKAGQPLELEDWQKDFLEELFLYDRTTGLRVYREAVLLLPRKHGKSLLAAALSLFFLTEDRDLHGRREASPEVYTAANSRNQARLVFDQAVACAKKNDYFKNLVIQRHDVSNPSNDGVLRTISSEAANEHGLNPSAVIIDELHGANDDHLLAAMQTATGARSHPLLLVISTAGFKRGPLYEIIEQAQAMPSFCQEGSLSTAKDRDNGILFWRWSAPVEADETDPATWDACNPASWVTLDFLTQQFNSPTLSIENFNRYFLNRYVQSKDSFLPPGSWQLAGDKTCKIDDGSDIYVGVDLAKSYDHSAIVLAAPDGSNPSKYRVLSFIYENEDESDAMVFKVERKLRELASKYRVREIAYDPWRFDRSALELSSEGLPMVEFGQSNERMGPATERFLQVIKEQRITHNGDRTLSNHVANAVVRETPRGYRIDKSKTAEKIDGAVALIMAIDRAEANTNKPKRKVSLQWT